MQDGAASLRDGGLVDLFGFLYTDGRIVNALDEIRRVLKDGGVLIAPTFTHAGNSFTGKVGAFFMKLAGFPLHSRWTSEEYLRLLRQNSWTVRKSAVLKASFPLTYAECVKMEV